MSILFCIACCLSVFCQDRSRDFITTKNYFSPNDGLASREVFCALQDNDGFMWFGTRNGLNRYDGKNFKLYTRQKNGLAENKIIQLAKDNNHHLFIVYGAPGYSRSAMRIEVMDLRTDKLTTLKEAFPNLPFDQDYVYWIANGGDDLCFLVANPFRYWRLKAGGFKLICEMKKWDRPEYEKEFWLTSNGRYQTTWGPNCQFFRDCALLKLGDINPQYFCTATSTTAFPFSDGVFINSEKKLSFSREDVNRRITTARRSETTWVNSEASFRVRMIYFFYGNFSKVLAYTETDGLFVYDVNSLQKLLAPQELRISTVSGLYSYYIDRQNNIWICTAGGLIKINQERNRFSNYFTREQLRDSSENQARGIYADRAGTVYASIWSKLYYSSSGRAKYSQLGANKILYGLCWHMNKLYVGEFNIFLFERDKTEVFQDLTRSNLQEIWALDSLDSSRLLCGCTESIHVFDLAVNKIKTPVYRSASIPNVQFVYRFIRKKNKEIWAVAQNGLFLMNEKADTVIDFFGKASKDATHRLPFENMHDAYEDAAGVSGLRPTARAYTDGTRMLPPVRPVSRSLCSLTAQWVCRRISYIELKVTIIKTYG